MNKNKIFSVALFAENLKRFWAISVVGFLMYFISGPFVLLMSGSHLDGETVYMFSIYTASKMLANHNFGYVLMHFSLPVIAAVCVYAYLNRTASVGVMHSMPFSRRSLFVTNYVSGLVLSIMPAVLTWIITLFIVLTDGEIGAAAVNNWLLASFAIILFTYSCAVLACMVSGNGVITALTACAFNFVLPAVYFSLCGYADSFLKGFTYDGIWDTIVEFHPLLKALETNGGLDSLTSLKYIAVALIVAAAAFVLGKLRNLERCGDSYVFGWMQTVIGFLFAFFMTTMLGLILFEGWGLAAYALGFVLGFLVGQMISLKTFNIFSKVCLRNFVVFAAVMVALIASFTFDIFGYAKSQPATSKVESVTVEGVLSYRYRGNLTFEDAENIDTVKAFHKELIADDLEGYIWDSEVNRIGINYKLKNGKTVSRAYYVKPDAEKSDTFKKLSASDEVKAFADTVKKIDTKQMEVRVFKYNYDYEKYDQEMVYDGTEAEAVEMPLENVNIDKIMNLSEPEKKELLEAVAEDIQKDITQYRDRSELGEYISIEITSGSFENYEAASKKYGDVIIFSGITSNPWTGKAYSASFGLTVYPWFENTMNFINAHLVLGR